MKRNVSEGLLLFEEGTVCVENEYSFNMDSAHAICQSLGFVQVRTVTIVTRVRTVTMVTRVRTVTIVKRVRVVTMVIRIRT